MIHNPLLSATLRMAVIYEEFHVLLLAASYLQLASAWRSDLPDVAGYMHYLLMI